MTTGADPYNPNPQTPAIYRDEPARKSAPVLEVGAIAWIRQNLFRTWFDTILTILAGIFIVSVLTSTISWVITRANWSIINFNLRLLMIGRFELEYEWRIRLVVLLFAFVGGFALSAFGRASRQLVIGTIAVLIVLFVAPPLITATTPLPPSYLAVGNIDIVSGTATENAQPQLAFLGKGGEEISLTVAESLSDDDQTLALLHSFADEATNTLRNGAINRLEAIRLKTELEAKLAGNGLTPNQRERLTADLARITILETPITEAYQLNSLAVNVRILRGSTGEVLGEGTVERGSDPLTVTLPEDGWYIIEKTPVGDAEGITLLETHGIYPLLERSITRIAEDAAIGTSQSITQYVRFTDFYTTEETRPEIGDENVPMALSIDLRYQGLSTLPHYLRLYVVPFFNQLRMPLLMIVIAVALGYLVSRQGIDRFMSASELPRSNSVRIATWLIIAAPPIAFIIIYGTGGILPFTDTRRWGGLMLTIFLSLAGIVLSFPLGLLLALGRRSSLPVISQACTLYIEFVRGVPLITVLFMSQLLLPLVSPGLADFPNVLRATVGIILFSAAYLAENVRGGLQSVPKGQIEAATALSLSSSQIALFITLPQALRAVIPALVGQFISLFKDTSLVAIVGLQDLLGMAQVVYAQTEFIGLRRETLLFIALIYFTFSYSMGAISRQIESSGSGATRKQQL